MTGAGPGVLPTRTLERPPEVGRPVELVGQLGTPCEGRVDGCAIGVEERAIMRQPRHRSVVVARRYIRDGLLF